MPVTEPLLENSGNALVALEVDGEKVEVPQNI